MYRKRSNPKCNGNRRDEVALRTTCTKNVTFKIIKIRTGCHRVVHGTYLSVPFPFHSNLCLSHPVGRFPWDSHRNDIPMDNPGLSVCRILLLQRKSKPGHTKPSTGQRVGHSCFRSFEGYRWVTLKWQRVAYLQIMSFTERVKLLKGKSKPRSSEGKKLQPTPENVLPSL